MSPDRRKRDEAHRTIASAFCRETKKKPRPLQTQRRHREVIPFNVVSRYDDAPQTAESNAKAPARGDARFALPDRERKVIEQARPSRKKHAASFRKAARGAIRKIAIKEDWSKGSRIKERQRCRGVSGRCGDDETNRRIDDGPRWRCGSTPASSSDHWHTSELILFRRFFLQQKAGCRFGLPRLRGEFFWCESVT